MRVPKIIQNLLYCSIEHDETIQCWFEHTEIMFWDVYFPEFYGTINME